MIQTPKARRARRHCIALAGAALATAALIATHPATAHAVPATPPNTVVLIVGDSLSAEYGLRRGTGWVSLLEQRLSQQHLSATVINASISGDTTAGGRSRLPALLAQHHPTHVVIELGANDALRGLPLADTRANLMAMVQTARQSGAQIMLIGIQVPPNYGRRYTDAFGAIFADIAQAEGTAWVPFLLKDVADAPEPLRWFQADRLHPTEEAQPLLLNNVWPVFKPWLTGDMRRTRPAPPARIQAR